MSQENGPLYDLNILPYAQLFDIFIAPQYTPLGTFDTAQEAIWQWVGVGAAAVSFNVLEDDGPRIHVQPTRFEASRVVGAGVPHYWSVILTKKTKPAIYAASVTVHDIYVGLSGMTWRGGRVVFRSYQTPGVDARHAVQFFPDGLKTDQPYT